MVVLDREVEEVLAAPSMQRSQKNEQMPHRDRPKGGPVSFLFLQ
jgi:hypothetical protein